VLTSVIQRIQTLYETCTDVWNKHHMFKKNYFHWLITTVVYLTIRLWAWDFYEVIVDEAEGRINYRLIEIESELSNCFNRILTEINANNGFQLFFHALLNFTCKQSRRNWTVPGKFAVVYACTPFFNIFKFLKSRNRKCASFSLFRNLTTRLHLNFLPKLQKNYENIVFRGQPTATVL